MNVTKTGLGWLIKGAAVLSMIFLSGVLAWPAQFHYQSDCTACHDPGGTTSNLAAVAEWINGEQVVFQIRPDHYADGSGSRVCEVCHTATNYYRTDGTSPGGDHYPGQDCSACHFHCQEFFHSGGTGTGCESCHGHDAGYEYEPGQQSQGAGTYLSHSTHTEHDGDDIKGPFVDCSLCHDTTSYPSFKSGTDSNGDGCYNLSETDVCDGCHSPEGAFDGVNDPQIGAKANWQGGVYQYPEARELKPSLENWCAGCHDDGISVCGGVLAPNVMGDNATYGYNITGHKIACSACHTLTATHIDGEPRTYAHDSNPWDPDDPFNYQRGYRLKESMIIPLGNGPLGGFGQNRFALCFTCHDYAKLLGNTPPFQTNFQDDGINRHRSHLGSGRFAWDSDWDYLLVPNEIILDNPQATFVGEWPSATALTGYYGADYQWHAPGDGSSTATWTPYIPQTGQYKVYARWPASLSWAGDAKFTIAYDGGSFLSTVNQQVNGHIWNLLGTFSFVQGTAGYVELSDLADSNVVADAVKFGDPIIDSRLSCPACHNVHGSPNPVMIRHGELISTPGHQDKVPALNFRWYKADAYTSTIFADESSFGDIPVLGGIGGGTLEDSMVCIGCHAGPPPIKYDRVYQALAVPQGTWTKPPLPPSMRLLYPSPNSSEIPVDSDLSFLLLSNGMADLDLDALSVSLEGLSSNPVTYHYGDSELQVTGLPGRFGCYEVHLNPASDFNYQDTITVTVSASDTAGSSLTSPTWSFETSVSSDIIWRSPQIVYSENLFYSPEQLIDDHPETSNADSPFPEHWVIYDLGQSYQVSRIRFFISTSMARMWTISVSDNPEDFGVPLISNWLAAVEGSPPQWVSTSFTPAQGRYLRIFTGRGYLVRNTLQEIDFAE